MDRCYFQAVIPPDEKYEKMIRIRDACVDASVDVPRDVLDYIENNKPQTEHRVVEIECTEGGRDDFSMFILPVRDIPDRASAIRFVVEHRNGRR